MAIAGVPLDRKFATGALGAATGLSLSEFFSEFIARATGQTGWAKVGVKATIKLLISILFWTLAARVIGPLTKLFLQVAAWTGTGSIAWDVIMQAFPGGVWGLAERAAVSVRAAAYGAERVAAELSVIERVGVTPTPIPSFI